MGVRARDRGWGCEHRIVGGDVSKGLWVGCEQGIVGGAVSKGLWVGIAPPLGTKENKQGRRGTWMELKFVVCPHRRV